MQSQTTQTLALIEPVLLSPLEEMFWRIEEHTAGAYRVAVVLRMEGYLSSDLVAKSLQHLQRRHPKLRAVVSRGTDRRLRYNFTQLPPPIPCEITEYYGEQSPWRETASRLLQRKFPVEGPLGAVAVLRNAIHGCSELIIVLHHAIADGLSAIIVADDFLSEYARWEQDLNIPPRPDLSAVTAMRAKASGRWRDRFGVMRRALRLHREERRSKQTTLPVGQNVSPQTQWVHWVFSRQDTVALIRSCRSQETSISGLLVAALCFALTECLPPGEALFKSQFPLNLREALGCPGRPVTDQDLGCFVGIMNDFHRLSPLPSFWDLARSAHQSLQTFRKGGGPSFSYNLAAVATSSLFARSAPKILAASGKRVTLLATNYGVIPLKSRYGSLRPKACTLTFNNNGDGPSLVMETLVLGQQLNLGLAADQLDPTFWAKLQVVVRRHLETASQAVPRNHSPHYASAAAQDEQVPQRTSVAPHE